MTGTPDIPSAVSVSRRYTVIGRLDQGGMGEVFLARVNGPAGFSRDVVIKRMRRHLAAEPRHAAAFVDEARLMARMSHPNVCQVHDLVMDGGQLYLTMEYLEGLPLSVLCARGPLPARVLCGIALQVLDGLAHVHTLRRADGTSAGVVHRDISPQNLLLTTSGVAKILDFGIAKTRDSAERTMVGRVKGKPAYMAPEQLAGLDVDGRADLYALGIVLGRAAADAGGGPLAPILQRALAADPDARFPSARAMREAVEKVAARLGGAASTGELADWLATSFVVELADRRSWAARAATTGSGGTIPLPPPSAELLRAPASPPPRRRRVPMALATAAGLSLALVTILALDRSATDAASAAALPAVAAAPAPAAAAAPVPAAAPAPAPAAGAAPAPVPAAAPAPVRASAARSPHRSREHSAPSAPGYVSVVSRPYGFVTIDGDDMGMTPLWRVALRPGKHRVEVVAADGRRRDFAVHVESGAHIRRRVAWEPEP